MAAKFATLDAKPEVEKEKEVEAPEHKSDRVPDSSPELPLAQSYSRSLSIVEPTLLTLD